MRLPRELLLLNLFKLNFQVFRHKFDALSVIHPHIKHQAPFLLAYPLPFTFMKRFRCIISPLLSLAAREKIFRFLLNLSFFVFIPS